MIIASEAFYNYFKDNSALKSFYYSDSQINTIKDRLKTTELNKTVISRLSNLSYQSIYRFMNNKSKTISKDKLDLLVLILDNWDKFIVENRLK